jgi:hypothetical protein
VWLVWIDARRHERRFERTKPVGERQRGPQTHEARPLLGAKLGHARRQQARVEAFGLSYDQDREHEIAARLPDSLAQAGRHALGREGDDDRILEPASV